MESALIVMIVVFGAANAVTEYHRVRAHYNTNFADEEMVVDFEENYVMAIVSKIHGSGRPSINLHDVGKGFSAYKDVESGVCYIQSSNHTMDEFSEIVYKIRENVDLNITQVFQWDCTQAAIIPESMLSTLYGSRIGQFCENYDSFYVTKSSSTSTAPEKRSVDTAFFCLLCFNRCS